MTDITELARRMKAAAVRAKTATEEYASGHMSVSVCFAECEEFNRLTDGPDNILALVEALEKAQQERENWRTSFDNERFRADKLKAHIDEMTAEQTASINELSRIIQREIKAKREAEKRIAELEPHKAALLKFIRESCYVFDGYDADISDAYIDAASSSLMPKIEAEPCHHCSGGSYSGLPGGACEHCMGTGLDNPAAELKSRTVKLPDDEDGQAYGFGKWSNGKLPATAGTMTIAYCEDAWRAAFEVFASAAGIKVEAE